MALDRSYLLANALSVDTMKGKMAVGKSDKKTASARSKLKAPVGSNSPGHYAGNRSQMGIDEVLPKCGGCEIVITNEVSALQCDRCVSMEGWKCSECLGLSNAVYAALFGCKELKWFCAVCDAQEVQGNGSQQNVGTSDGIKEVLSVIGKVLEKIGSIDDKLGTKVDATEIALVEVRVMDKLTELVDRVTKLEEGRREGGIDTAMREAGSLGAPLHAPNMDQPPGSGTSGAGTIYREDEEYDLERRKNCVIVHGIQESQASDSLERKEEDISQMMEVFHDLGTEDVEIVKAFRLGKPSPRSEEGEEGGEQSVPRTRPLKIMLRTEAMKISILNKAKNLRAAKEGAWKGVVIHQDLTPREREMRKGVLEDLRKRTAAGEKNLIMFRGRIVQKRTIRATGAVN